MFRGIHKAVYPNPETFVNMIYSRVSILNRICRMADLLGGISAGRVKIWSIQLEAFTNFSLYRVESHYLYNWLCLYCGGRILDAIISWTTDCSIFEICLNNHLRWFKALLTWPADLRMVKGNQFIKIPAFDLQSCCQVLLRLSERRRYHILKNPR